MDPIKSVLGLNQQAPALPPIPEAPPPVPDVNQIQQATRDNEALSKKRQGRASALLTGAQGDLSPVQTATKTLLGQ